MNSNTNLNTCPIIVTIVNQKSIQNNIEYKIQLHSELSDKDWQINKTFTELTNFHNYLLSNFTSIPLFPDVDFAFLNLQKTKVLLELFLTEITQRDDIISNPECEKFLNLKNHFEKFYDHQPLLMVNDIKSNHLSPIDDKLYLNLYMNIVTVLCYDEKEKLFKEIVHTKTKSNSIRFKYIKINKINLILIGEENGIIEVFSLAIEKSPFNIEKMNEVSPHKNPILGFGFSPSNGYLYSVSTNDNKICISEINYEKTIKEVKLNDKLSRISAFEYDDKNKLCFVCDSNSLYIYSIENSIKFTLVQAFHGNEGNISILKYYNKINCFLLGTDNSIMSLYYFDNQKNIIYRKATAYCDKSKRYPIVGLCYIEDKKMCVVSLSNGKIQFWSFYSTNPIYVIDCCTTHKFDIFYEEDRNVLICNCDEENVKIYKLPKLFPAEAILEQKKEEIKSKFDYEGALNSDNDKSLDPASKKESNQVDDDYDSSLDGWDDGLQVLSNQTDKLFAFPF